MKSLKILLIPFLLFGMVASDAVWADRGHPNGHFHDRGRVGVFIAAPLFYPGYYPGYYPPDPYYYPQPPVYVEQGNPVSGPGSYSYYCSSPSGYYPAIRACPGGWHQVIPTTPPY